MAHSFWQIVFSSPRLQVFLRIFIILHKGSVAFKSVHHLIDWLIDWFKIEQISTIPQKIVAVLSWSRYYIIILPSPTLSVQRLLLVLWDHSNQTLVFVNLFLLSPYENEHLSQDTVAALLTFQSVSLSSDVRDGRIRNLKSSIFRKAAGENVVSPILGWQTRAGSWSNFCVFARTLFSRWCWIDYSVLLIRSA